MGVMRKFKSPYRLHITCPILMQKIVTTLFPKQVNQSIAPVEYDDVSSTHLPLVTVTPTRETLLLIILNLKNIEKFYDTFIDDFAKKCHFY